ncbi:MAG: phosphomannomutase/phosphoglucomutase [Myxococcota bacterium]
MKPGIFKAYDIRGLAPEELDARGALAIGRAFARHLEGGPIAVGYDMRASADELRDAFLAGLCGEGRSVIDIGRVSTPMLYFATASSGAAGGAMITASHNPGAYNGFKLCGRNALPIGIESGLAAIRDRALALAGDPAPPTRAGVTRRDVKPAYFDMLLELFPARPRLRAVIDAGNGIAGEALIGLLDRLPLQAKRMYFEPDGSFPNHEADPLKAENLHDLQRAVRAEQADLGIAFDGDGDRAVFVDEQGDAVPADLMTALFCDVMLERRLLGAKPGIPILYDLRSSRIVPETVRARGAEPVRGRVGHAFMKAVMRERGACFGGELSGHYYFRFPAGYIADDGAAAMLLLLEVLAARARPLSELWRPFRRYRQSGEINRRVADVPATLARVRAAFPDGEADELDGLTISYPSWWFNLRPSNTEPLLRLNLETPDDESLARQRDRILRLIDA